MAKPFPPNFYIVCGEWGDTEGAAGDSYTNFFDDVKKAEKVYKKTLEKACEYCEFGAGNIQAGWPYDQSSHYYEVFLLKIANTSKSEDLTSSDIPYYFQDDGQDDLNSDQYIEKCASAILGIGQHDKHTEKETRESFASNLDVYYEAILELIE